MGKSGHNLSAGKPDAQLFDRIVTILEEARGNLVRAVNTQMVTAYWLIGREIVEEIQGGEERAEYGKQVIERLSTQLTERYGKGFSFTNLWYFRQFYLAFAHRAPILHPAGGELAGSPNTFLPGRESEAEAIPRPTGVEFDTNKLTPSPCEVELAPEKNPYPTGTKSPDIPIPSAPGLELATGGIRNSSGDRSGGAFRPELSWSHYRALMRVDEPAARTFYEREAAECGWSKAQLERQIHTAYYQRIVANRGAEALGANDRERLPGEPIDAADLLKSPYVLEFLGLPDGPVLHESHVEQAIIDNLQSFLLELGKGFAFVARQRHIRFDGEDFYIDLVFYNFILKCFLLIDLKNGKLTHRDVGQMDGYVRLFEDRFKTPGDNPTIGLILCSDKSKAVAKYSVLSESRQIFASKYLQFLPSEEELRLEIQRERRQIEAAMEEAKDDD